MDTKRLVIFDSNFQIKDIVNGIANYTYDTKKISWFNGMSSLDLTNQPFILVDASKNITEITEQDIVSFFREIELSRLSEECQQLIYKGFVSQTTGHMYGFDKEDQANFNQQATIFLLDSTETEIDWKTLDAGVVVHSRDNFIAICKESKKHKVNTIKNYWAVKGKVLAYTKYEEVVGIGSLEEEIAKLQTPAPAPASTEPTMQAKSMKTSVVEKEKALVKTKSS